jgi:fibronectin type 3 domain-containing protein
VTSAAGATTYYFYRSETSGGIYLLVSSGASNSFVDSNVIPGQSYYYKVQTVTSADGYSNMSAASTAGSTATTVSAPATLTTSQGVTNGGNISKIMISCSAVSGATRYDIYRSTSAAGVYSYVGNSTDLPTTAYADNTGLSYGVKYYYKVKVYRAAPQSYSNDSAASAGGYLQFPSVTGVVASKGTDVSQISVHGSPTSKIALNWNTSSYGSASLRYDVYGDTTSGVPSNDTVTSAVNVNASMPTADGNCADDSTGTSSDPIAEGTVFYYKVVVKDDTNFPGAASDKSLSATDSGYLQYTAPTMSGLANNQTDVSLSWTTKTAATVYTAYEDGITSIYSGALTNCSYNPANSGVDHSYTVTVESSASSMNVNYNRSAASAPITRRWNIPNFNITLSGLSTVAPTGSATVNWTASAIKALSYTLEYSLNGGTSWTTLSTAATSPYTHSSLAAGNYTYRVTAVSAPNSQACSANLANTVHFAAPSAPTAVNGVSQISLSWPVVTGANRYYVYRSDYGFTTGSHLAIVTTNSYNDTSANDPAVAPTQYTYEIVAWNNGADYAGCDSAFGSVSLAANRIFAAPNSSLAASAGTYTDRARVSWGAVTGADRYDVYSSADGFAFPIATGVAATTYDDYSVNNGTSYTYKIVAGVSNAVYNSAQSSATSVGYKRLAAPSTVSSSAGSFTSYVRVSWAAVTDAASYSVYSSADGYSSAIATGLTSVSYDDSSANVGSQYTYKVVAVLGGTYNSLLSDSPVSNAGYRRLEPPSSVSASTGLSVSYVRVSWPVVTGATSYSVYSSADGYASAIATGVSALYYDDGSAAPGTSYTYKVVAVYDLSGTYDSLLSLSPVSPAGYVQLAAPSVSLSQGAVGEIDVSWGTGVTGADSYTLYYSVDPDTSGTANSIVLGNVLTYSHTSLASGTTYYYSVKALNSGQSGATSAFSAVQSISAP